MANSASAFNQADMLGKPVVDHGGLVYIQPLDRENPETGFYPPGLVPGYDDITAPPTRDSFSAKGPIRAGLDYAQNGYHPMEFDGQHLKQRDLLFLQTIEAMPIIDPYAIPTNHEIDLLLDTFPDGTPRNPMLGGDPDRMLLAKRRDILLTYEGLLQRARRLFEDEGPSSEQGRELVQRARNYVLTADPALATAVFTAARRDAQAQAQPQPAMEAPAENKEAVPPPPPPPAPRQRQRRRSSGEAQVAQTGGSGGAPPPPGAGGSMIEEIQQTKKKLKKVPTKIKKKTLEEEKKEAIVVAKSKLKKTGGPVKREPEEEKGVLAEVRKARGRPKKSASVKVEGQEEKELPPLPGLEPVPPDESQVMLSAYKYLTKKKVDFDDSKEMIMSLAGQTLRDVARVLNVPGRSQMNVEEVRDYLLQNQETRAILLDYLRRLRNWR